MPIGRLEHTNISVTDPDRSAALLIDLLGWEERWRGESKMGGRSIHVGEKHDYIALYTGNHVAFTVDDLDAAEKVVTFYGLKPFGHDDYEPGRRFYFFDWDGIEFEVVSYE